LTVKVRREYDGSGSHSGIIAGECGMPAVADIYSATKILKDG